MLNRTITALVAATLLAMPSTVSAQNLPPSHVDDFSGKPRVVVISDIGNEPDDRGIL